MAVLLRSMRAQKKHPPPAIVFVSFPTTWRVRAPAPRSRALVSSPSQDVRVDPLTGKLPYTGLVSCATQVFQKEGPLAFWTGFGAYYGRCAPHAMIILLTLGEVNKVYTSTFNTG